MTKTQCRYLYKYEPILAKKDTTKYFMKCTTIEHDFRKKPCVHVLLENNKKCIELIEISTR